MKTDLLIYDVPTKSQIPNPSPRLRRVAIRINLSCWVLPTDRVPWNYLNELREEGVRWHLVPQSEEGSEKLTEMALDSLRQEIRSAVKRTEKSLDLSGEKFVSVKEDPDCDGSDLERAKDKHDKHIKTTMKRINNLLKDIESAAKVFAIDPASLPLVEAKAKADALQMSAHRRAELFADMVQQVKGTEMELAAREDEIPAGVLADWLEERGHDVSAVRAAF